MNASKIMKSTKILVLESFRLYGIYIHIYTKIKFVSCRAYIFYIVTDLLHWDDVFLNHIIHYTLSTIHCYTSYTRATTTYASVVTNSTVIDHISDCFISNKCL